jgi:23S rRNA (cytidine2498-2'-O)-methyltransferase
MLCRCQPGFENWLHEELATLGITPRETGSGWALLDQDLGSSALDAMCFPHWAMLRPVEITGDSVNSMAQKVAHFFLTSAKEEKFEAPWSYLVDTAAGLDGLGRRADAVGKAAAELLKKRMSRVARLATDLPPRGVGVVRGLYLYFVDFRRAFVSRDCFFGGQRRMADDPLAPSRSYLKIEEAYGVLGCEPAAGETVVDLGAAPGGWSYSAAKRGARVIAVDNGPLKGGALNHPHIEHRREDAFRFSPSEGVVYDWLFCDLVEEPHHVMRNLVEPWLMRRWCRSFVVILKFGRTNPVTLLRELRRPGGVLTSGAKDVRIRHLFHDREEFTIVGKVAE